MNYFRSNVRKPQIKVPLTLIPPPPKISIGENHLQHYDQWNLVFISFVYVCWCWDCICFVSHGPPLSPCNGVMFLRIQQQPRVWTSPGHRGRTPPHPLLQIWPLEPLKRVYLKCLLSSSICYITRSLKIKWINICMFTQFVDLFSGIIVLCCRCFLGCSFTLQLRKYYHIITTWFQGRFVNSEKKLVHNSSTRCQQSSDLQHSPIKRAYGLAGHSIKITPQWQTCIINMLN